MKKLTVNLMVAAATLVVASGVASAQAMKAEVPFRFQASGAWLEPGTYTVEQLAGSTSIAVYRLRNADNGGTVLAVSLSRLDTGGSSPGLGKLVFQCAGGQCALVQLWDGPREVAYQFGHPKWSKSEALSAAVIAIRLEKGE
jgi:hypothetical protein